MTRAAVLFAFVALSTGCGLGAIDGPGPGGGTTTPTEVDTLQLRTIDWNPAKADVGTVAAVVEDGATTVLFGSKGATVMTGGAVKAVATGASTWRTANAIPSSDGAGTWTVGVDGNGKVLRLRSDSALEDVGARYGLSTVKVTSVVPIGDREVAFGWPGGLAIADGDKVTRWSGPKDGLLAGGGDRVAWIEGGIVHVFGAKAGTHRTYAVEGAQHVAIDGSGRLVVSTARALWVQKDEVLVQRWVWSSDVTAMTAAGSRVWMSVGGELAVLNGDALARSQGANVPPDARLHGTAAGDVWIVASSAVRKLSGSAASEAVADWEANIKPVFARVCASCHNPGGSANVDLSTHKTWVDLRASIHQRVIVDRTMPPKGVPFQESDREAIRSWLERNKP